MTNAETLIAEISEALKAGKVVRINKRYIEGAAIRAIAGSQSSTPTLRIMSAVLANERGMNHVLLLHDKRARSQAADASRHLASCRNREALQASSRQRAANRFGTGVSGQRL